jgi:hypothetical protein
MNKPKFIFKFFLFLSVLSAANVFAQTETKQTSAEPCYEVVLQILIASNGPSDKNALPPALSNVVKKLKTLYAFSDYRLTQTFLQRTTNYVEYKSLLNDFNQNANQTAPVFSDWSLKGFRKASTSNGRNMLEFDSFRFGARVPVMTSAKDESGKTSPIINYESIGINTMRFNLSENEPTIIGSLATSKPDELMFLVLTVKPAE